MVSMRHECLVDFKDRPSLAAEKPVRVIIVEVQLKKDDDKRFTWPAYLTVSRDQPMWCAELIELGVAGPAYSGKPRGLWHRTSARLFEDVVERGRHADPLQPALELLRVLLREDPLASVSGTATPRTSPPTGAPYPHRRAVSPPASSLRSWSTASAPIGALFRPGCRSFSRSPA